MFQIKKPSSGGISQRVTTHPRAVLVQEFLKPLEISQHKLAMDLRLPVPRIGEKVYTG